MRPRPTAPDASAAANADKTAALVGTCSGMLALALGLRVLLVVVFRRGLGRDPLAHRRRVLGLTLRQCQHALDVSVYIVLWYGISIGMTLFNKWFLRVWAGGGYPFATTMTCLNMLTKCLLSRLVVGARWWPASWAGCCCSGRGDDSHRRDPVPPLASPPTSDDDDDGGGTARPTTSTTTSRMPPLRKATFWRRAVPIGVCTSLDIMLSNLSFFYITVTFYTIVKSGANVWNLLFSIAMGHQRRSWALGGVIGLISSGLALASYGSTAFVLHGFVLVLAASILGTLRWVLTQSLLQEMDDQNGNGGARSNPRHRIVGVVYYISPTSALVLLPIALATEGRELATSRFVHDPWLLGQSLGFILVSGCLAFALIFIEILLVKKTSALSLGIAGSFKDVTQVLLAVIIFGDRLIPINVVGLVVATTGMLVYAFLKHGEADGSSGRYERVATSENDHVKRQRNRGDNDDSLGLGFASTSSTSSSSSLSSPSSSLPLSPLSSSAPSRGLSPVVIHMQELKSLTKKSSASELELTRRESKEYIDDDGDIQHV